MMWQGFGLTGKRWPVVLGLPDYELRLLDRISHAARSSRAILRLVSADGAGR